MFHSVPSAPSPLFQSVCKPQIRSVRHYPHRALWSTMHRKPAGTGAIFSAVHGHHSAGIPGAKPPCKNWNLRVTQRGPLFEKIGHHPIAVGAGRCLGIVGDGLPIVVVHPAYNGIFTHRGISCQHKLGIPNPLPHITATPGENH